MHADYQASLSEKQLSIVLNKEVMFISAKTEVKTSIRNKDGTWRDSSVLRALDALAENLGSVPSTHILAHNHL